jgi:hypothetical protein
VCNGVGTCVVYNDVGMCKCATALECVLCITVWCMVWYVMMCSHVVVCTVQCSTVSCNVFTV